MVGESPGEPSRGGFLALELYKFCAMPREEGGGGSRKARHSSRLGGLAQVLRALAYKGSW